MIYIGILYIYLPIIERPVGHGDTVFVEGAVGLANAPGRHGVVDAGVADGVAVSGAVTVVVVLLLW